MFGNYEVENLYYAVVTAWFTSPQGRHESSGLESCTYSTALYLKEDGEYKDLCRTKLDKKYRKKNQADVRCTVEYHDAFSNYPEVLPVTKKNVPKAYLSEKEALSVARDLSIVTKEKRYEQLQQEQSVINPKQKSLYK